MYIPFNSIILLVIYPMDVVQKLRYIKIFRIYRYEKVNNGTCYVLWGYDQ